MRSTGEVMGIDRTFGLAFAKSQVAAGERLPEQGAVFFSLADRDKPQGRIAARSFVDQGFQIVATAGTRRRLRGRRHPGRHPGGQAERRGARPDRGRPHRDRASIDLVVNCPRGRGPRPTATTSGPRPRRTRSRCSPPPPPPSPPPRASSTGRPRPPREVAPGLPPFLSQLLRRRLPYDGDAVARPVRRLAGARLGDVRTAPPSGSGPRRAVHDHLSWYQNEWWRGPDHPDWIGLAGQPRHDRVGDGRVRHRAARLRRPGLARRGGHQVAGRTSPGTATRRCAPTARRAA